ncbi:hypothetical protein GALMADRAFT_209182 [Galerina marginata CBS 339.88]|uniref:DUF4604 domain-containing protein n=1 Tax=Galerina marginata (strain CBS 339.88) TaxID=685588 RepID=A0A067TFW3_GALM3|nr:hypothetical protein GALMADRAFT_209182 [Galerina marginata CBS 339.88]
MAPREPTRAQLSSKLAYQANTPSFLLKLQNRMNGIPDEEEDDEEEFEYVGGGRAPIPRRPAIPERPAEDPGSADEDFADEKPQVVVLKAGKHLTEMEAENVRRAEKGLPPLPEPKSGEKEPTKEASKESSSSNSKPANLGLSFSSSSKAGTKSNKRKAVGQLEELKAELKSKEKSGKPTSKKSKKTSKTLLSFGDDT